MNDIASESRPWTYEQVQELIALARENVPASVISMKTKRSQSDVHAKLSELGLSVPPEA